jgi:hypothetical protein
LHLLSVIKDWFEDQSLNFTVPNVMAVVILAGSSQSYPHVAPTSQGGF